MADASWVCGLRLAPVLAPHNQPFHALLPGPRSSSVDGLGVLPLLSRPAGRV